VFTARYALSPYIKQRSFVFKGLNCFPFNLTSFSSYVPCFLSFLGICRGSSPYFFILSFWRYQDGTRVHTLSLHQLIPPYPFALPIVPVPVFKQPPLIPAPLSSLRCVRWHSIYPHPTIPQASPYRVRLTTTKYLICYVLETQPPHHILPPHLMVVT
jgi:hypothetical protein